MPLMCTGSVMWVCIYSMCVCVRVWGNKGAGSETLVNWTIIWRPGEDSQQPLTVCLPERPTRLFLLHLQGRAGKGRVYLSVCTSRCNHVHNAVFMGKWHFVGRAKTKSPGPSFFFFFFKECFDSKGALKWINQFFQFSSRTGDVFPLFSRRSPLSCDESHALPVFPEMMAST